MNDVCFDLTPEGASRFEPIIYRILEQEFEATKGNALRLIKAVASLVDLRPSESLQLVVRPKIRDKEAVFFLDLNLFCGHEKIATVYNVTRLKNGRLYDSRSGRWLCQDLFEHLVWKLSASISSLRLSRTREEN